MSWNIVRVFVFSVVIVCGSMPTSAQDEARPFNRRIVGGQATTIKQHPWQVALNIDGTLCGGSIIGERWILTAAHCVVGLAPPMRAKTGVTEYRSSGTWVVAERTVVHEAYNAKTFEHDIALIKLDSLQPNSRIALPAPSVVLPRQQPLEVTGWGATTEGGRGAAHLVKAVVPAVETSLCNAPHSYNGRIKDGMMCAGRKEGGTDSCQGDSGGPLVWRTANGPVLVGVVSFGEGCARKLKYGVYTRVATYRNWIEKTMADN